MTEGYRQCNTSTPEQAAKAEREAVLAWLDRQMDEHRKSATIYRSNGALTKAFTEDENERRIIAIRKAIANADHIKEPARV